MDKQSSQAPWIPETPVKPIAPICPYTAEEESNWIQAVQGNRFFMNMADLDQLSFTDALLAVANTCSSAHFSGYTTHWANNGIQEPSRNVVCGGSEMEMLKRNREMMMEKANEAVDNLSSVSNIVTEQIKTPEKPKRKKHRPKVRKDANSKPHTPWRPVSDSQQKKTPTPRRRKKEDEVNKDQESTPAVAKKLCRRALDFDDENQPKGDTKHADETESGIQEPKAPSTPNRKRNQSKRKGKEPKNQDGVAKRRQGNQPTNLSGIQYNELCDQQRSDAIRVAGQQFDVSSFGSNCYSFTSQPTTYRVLTMEEKGQVSFDPSVRLDGTDTPAKKRTLGHARFRNLSSINEVSEQIPQNNKNKLLVDTPATLSKKKQKTKSETSQTNQEAIVPIFYQSPASFPGLPPDEIWKHMFSVDAITQKLCLLDINSQRNELILFRGGAGAVVPLIPVKKQRRARPRVDLDNETDRVWKLLMDNINSNGVDGSDEEKAKWWEAERELFKGRAESFIGQMHRVQGDRRFTPWKGSVVDSIVGVFLTQNVSDHLSSSAFMSLAAEFPAPSVPSGSFDVETMSMAPIQITYLDSEESISNPPVHKQSSEEKDYANRDETSRSSSEIASSSAHEPVGQITSLEAHLDSDGKGSSVEVDQRDETYLVQNLFPSEDSALTCQNSEIARSSSEGEHHASFVKLLQGLEESNQKIQYENSRQEVGVSSNPCSLQESPKASPGDCSSEVKDFKSLKGQTRSSDDSNEPFCCMPSTKQKEELITETSIPDINESTTCLDLQPGTETPSGPDSSPKKLNPMDAKGKKVLKEKKEEFDWDSLRREAQARHGKRERTTRTMDSVDWEAIRTADVNEVAATIKSRGMNNKLAERIQGFLDRLVSEHESIDLEWLRDVDPDKAKEYLLSFRGLGLKSVECVRLLTLHHVAFPVDTNVGRIAVRLGWVPLQPLPESLQLHLLEMYPVLESIQKYLWPRLCKLSQETLYELHYQMITFGKVFCTKSKPNCNACPMRGDCRHFASAFASARLALPSTERGIGTPDINPPSLHLPEPLQREQGLEVLKHSKPTTKVTCEPLIELPASPEPECADLSIDDIEDAFFEDPEEIPRISLDMDAFTSNLKKIMELQDGNMSTALVALTAETASIPMPKLKNISQLRTEHYVYELPDSHPLVDGLDKREPDDPSCYLLAIWTPGETIDSIQPGVSKCVSQGTGVLCNEETCFSCNNIKEARSQTVRGTILIPCRTAMRGSFPLNGTYFQVNEVFADHESSLRPIDVPRRWIWNLRRKTVYFGTSVPSIFKGLSTETIQQCFWKGFVCVRGFDRKTRAPRPLIARLHFPASKMGKSRGKPTE